MIYLETENSSYTAKTTLFVVSNDFQESLAEVDVLAAVVSDHSAIQLILCESKELIRGPSYWKFDSSLVNDKTYVENLNIELTQ